MGRSISAPGSVTFRSRSTISPPRSGSYRGRGSGPAQWNGRVDRTGLRSHGSRTPTATGSSWCSGRRGTLTGSPQPTFSTNRGVSRETEIWSGGRDLNPGPHGPGPCVLRLRVGALRDLHRNNDQVDVWL